ncbi:protein YmfJ [Bacillus freudenreichii]|nr:protein YmfJ [Bacillus freudenreichii]
MSVLENWEQWKNFLGDRLDQAQQQGMSQDIIDQMAHQVGDYLAKQVDPKNEQERVLSDLWSVASEEEQQAIARVMVKLVENNGTH